MTGWLRRLWRGRKSDGGGKVAASYCDHTHQAVTAAMWDESVRDNAQALAPPSAERRQVPSRRTGDPMTHATACECSRPATRRLAVVSPGQPVRFALGCTSCIDAAIQRTSLRDRIEVCPLDTPWRDFYGHYYGDPQ